ncbi:MAG: hypothetical protein JRN52_02820 [Nitrososphaerota archaeon]|nr:hypothetical protein [Nitrososphaerota archaeon]
MAVVEPEFALNLGYVARCMANFGLEKLYVVSPDKLDKKYLEEASVFASHGSEIIENLRTVKSLSAIRRGSTILIGTTAIQARRRSNLARRTLSLEECASRVTRSLSSGGIAKACLVLGRDTTGLTNEELKSCDYNVTIRTDSDYNTLNISHAMAIILYEFARQLKQFQKVDAPVESAGRAERERTIRLFEELAAKSDFQRFKSNLLRQTLIRLLGRSDPTLRETYLLMGLASRALSKINRLESGQS